MTVTYVTPATYLGFLTYAGDAQRYEVGAGTRAAPEARKGTLRTTVAVTSPTWAGTSLDTWQTFGTWSGADLAGTIRKGTR